MSHFERALELAERGRLTASPNPVVGAVVVREGEIVGEGWHERRGEPHAEANALAAAGDVARGATLYVTLEPCSHHGRTPPCADAVVAAGVARVVVGQIDPNPEVSGAGVERLRAAGHRGRACSTTRAHAGSSRSTAPGGCSAGRSSPTRPPSRSTGE